MILCHTKTKICTRKQPAVLQKSKTIRSYVFRSAKVKGVSGNEVKSCGECKLCIHIQKMSDHSNHCDAAKDYTQGTIKLNELVYTSKAQSF